MPTSLPHKACSDIAPNATMLLCTASTALKWTMNTQLADLAKRHKKAQKSDNYACPIISTQIHIELHGLAESQPFITTLAR